MIHELDLPMSARILLLLRVHFPVGDVMDKLADDQLMQKMRISKSSELSSLSLAAFTWLALW